MAVHTLARSAYYRAGGLTEDEYDTPDGLQVRREGWAAAITAPEKRVVCAVRAGTIVGAATLWVLLLREPRSTLGAVPQRDTVF